MKSPVPRFLAIAALCCAPPAIADEAADLAAIRALYAKIDQGKPSKTEIIEFELKDDPMSGTITRRSFGEGLSAIKLAYAAGDHGGSDQSYYFDKEGLFFILVQDTSWHFAPDTTDEKPSTVETLTETRYYVRGGSLIHILRRSVTSSDAEKLPALIAKEENRKIEKDDQAAFLLKRAAALKTIESSAQAVKFFSAEN